MTAQTLATPLAITLHMSEDDVITGHDAALDAWLSQTDGQTVEQAAASLTENLMSIGMCFGQADQAAAIYGASKLLIQCAGYPTTGENP